MEGITGLRPALEAAIAARISTASSGAPAVASGVKAVTPVERTERTAPRTSRPAPDGPSRETSPRDNQREDEILREAVAELDARLPQNISLDIRYDDVARRTVVRGVSTVTGETVIEFPTEKMLNLIRSIRESLGVAVDERA